MCNNSQRIEGLNTIVFYSILRIEKLSEFTIHTSAIEQATDLSRTLYVTSTFTRPLVVFNITTTAEATWLKVRLVKGDLPSLKY